MDIHIPKSIRNWREFAKEYAIIVIGVMTALGAEQGVEWLHWQKEVKTSRAALVEEFRVNDYYFARRLAVAPCLDRQIREAHGIISDLLAKKPPRRFTVFHTGSGSLLSDSEWQSDRASQILTHFPRSELALMSRYYALLPDMRSFTSEEGAAWRELSILQDPPPGLELSLLMHLRVSLAAAETAERLIVLNSVRQLRTSEQLGHPRFAVDPDRIKVFCTQGTEAYARYVDTHDPTK